jgi:uncharacterized membrane protein YphA (DoxX/SURF4 family)
MNDIIEKLGLGLLLAMYLISGISKAFNFKSTRNAIISKFPIKLPIVLYTIALVCVILLLTVGSLTVIYTFLTKKLALISSKIVLLLILFTICATLMFHFPSEKEKYHFMKNMSIIGGFLILLSNILTKFKIQI